MDANKMKKDLENLGRQLAFKWISVPFSIMIVLFAGISYNLFSYFQQIGKAQGYGGFEMAVIKYSVLFGYYLGLIPGFIVKSFQPEGGKPNIAFFIAAVQAVLSFLLLGYIAENGEGDLFSFVLMVFGLWNGAMSGSLATIGAIVTCVKNFPAICGMLIVVIMMPYYKVAPYFEFSTRSSFFEDADLFWYFVIAGLVVGFVYCLAGLLLRKVEIHEKIEGVLAQYDKMALLIFTILQILFIVAFYVVSIIMEDWFVGSILFMVAIFVNFLALGLAIKLIYDRVKGLGLKDFANAAPQEKEISFGDYLKEMKYIYLVLGSFLVIGVTVTYNFNIFQVAFATGNIDSADNLLDTFWIADMLGRIVGGLTIYFFFPEQGYIGAITASGCAALGFGLGLLAESVGTSFLFASCSFAGFGNGLFWVVGPMICMDDAGSKNFGLNWGLILFVSVCGMALWGELFDWYYEYHGGGDKCSGTGCILPQFIIFGIFCIAGAGVSFMGHSEDQKKRGGDKKDASTGKSGKGGKGAKGDKAGKGGQKGDKGKSAGKNKSAGKDKSAGKTKSTGKPKSSSKAGSKKKTTK